jgi:hypothetical protein
MKFPFIILSLKLLIHIFCSLSIAENTEFIVNFKIDNLKKHKKGKVSLLLGK